MTFSVEPGESFTVSYVSDGVTKSYPIPDITIATFDVALYFNGIKQEPITHYTVHQGALDLTLTPLPPGYKVTITRV
jgi:hypothetical protein